MTAMQIELVDRVSVAATLGEGVTWDARTSDVLFTDIQQRCLYRYNLPSKNVTATQFSERLTAFGLTREPDWLIAAFESGFAWVYLPESEIRWIERPEAGDTGRRFNDGRVGPDGRFWCGTMVEDREKAGGRKGQLFCLNLDGAVTAVLGDIGISNSLAWSPDGATMYFADSPARKIWAFDYATSTGALSNQHVFAETPDGIFPDGAAVDDQGYLWSAQWGGSRIMRYAPDGSEAAHLAMPVSQPSCVAFGGDGLDLLCVTTAREGLSNDALAAEPAAGDLFIYRTPFKGTAAPLFGEPPPAR